MGSGWVGEWVAWWETVPRRAKVQQVDQLSLLFHSKRAAVLVGGEYAVLVGCRQKGIELRRLYEDVRSWMTLRNLVKVQWSKAQFPMQQCGESGTMVLGVRHCDGHLP